MSVVVTAVFTPVPGKKTELAEALRGAIPAVHAEEGCLLYAIHDAADGTITMIEKWASDELLKAHAQGEPVARLNGAIEHLLDQPVVVTTMTAIEAGTSEQGLL